MKILMINKFYFIKGGSERYFFELKSLLESKGHEVIPFAMAHPQNESSPYASYFVDYINFTPESRIEKLKTGFKSIGRILYSFQARRRLQALIRETRPDIAHLHMIDHQISPSILPVLKKAGIPIVQTIHTYKRICPSYRLYHMKKGRICEKCLGGRYYQALIQRCHKGSFLATLTLVMEMYLHHWLRTYRHIDLYLPPSHFMADMLIRGGVEVSKVKHLYYTIRIDEYPHHQPVQNYFIYYGRLSEEKGIFTLLKAMKLLRGGLLKIVGDGPIMPDLEAFTEKNQLTDFVKFTGALGGDVLKKIVAESQFVIVPSEWYENSPLVIYEASAMGKPVIGARIGGIPELIDEGRDGYLYSPGNEYELRDRIEQLLNQTDVWPDFGSAARKKAEALFHPDVHYQQIMDIYRAL